MTKNAEEILIISPQHGRKEGGIGTHPHDRTLETAFGRPKIDVIGDHEDSPVVQEALKNGIQLI